MEHFYVFRFGTLQGCYSKESTFYEWYVSWMQYDIPKKVPENQLPIYETFLYPGRGHFYFEQDFAKPLKRHFWSYKVYIHIYEYILNSVGVKLA